MHCGPIFFKTETVYARDTRVILLLLLFYVFILNSFLRNKMIKFRNNMTCEYLGYNYSMYL